MKGKAIKSSTAKLSGLSSTMSCDGKEQEHVQQAIEHVSRGTAPICEIYGGSYGAESGNDRVCWEAFKKVGELMHDHTSSHYKTTLQQQSASTQHRHLNALFLILSPLLA
jgi:hypothetical protein